MAFDKFIVWNWNRELFWKSVSCNIRDEGVVRNLFVLVCDFYKKWLKNRHVFCVSLFY